MYLGYAVGAVGEDRKLPGDDAATRRELAERLLEETRRAEEARLRLFAAPLGHQIERQRAVRVEANREGQRPRCRNLRGPTRRRSRQRQLSAEPSH